MTLLPRQVSLLALLATLAALSGCQSGISRPAFSDAANPSIRGKVHGGQQPVAGAAVQIYAVGTTGDGSAATPLFTTPLVTDASGNFTTSINPCPVSNPLVYLVATGGNPGLGAGGSNLQLAMIAALGPCSVAISGAVAVNEVTTVAAVYALAPYIASPTAIGSGTSDAAALAAAFTLASQFADIGNGTSPGFGVPTGYTAPSDTINTLADILATCINSPGGASGDGSACGTFIALTTPTGLTPPTDTLTALLDLANNPTLNTVALYNLATPTAPFQPTLTTAPAQFSVALLPGSPSFTDSPAAGITFPTTNAGSTSPSQTVTVTNTGNLTLLLSAAITGNPAYAPGFTQTQTSPIAVAPGESQSLSVSFNPGNPGNYVAALTFTAGNVQTLAAASIPLTGTATGGKISVANGAVAFSNVNLNSTAQATRTITNVGTGPAVITSINLSGPNAASFTQSNSCPSTLAVGASCTFAFTFTPTANGFYNASVDVNGPAIGSSFATLTSFALSGFGYVGANIVPSVTSYTFPSSPVGTPTAPLSVTLVNYGGTGVSPVIFNFTGANPSDFPETVSDCYSLAPNASCTVRFIFQPTGIGLRTASIIVADYQHTYLTIPVSGTGTSAQYGFSWSPLPVAIANNFGGLNNHQIVTVTNTGQSGNNISSVAITGPQAVYFGQTNNCTQGLISPGGTCQINIFVGAFNPPGTYTTNISVASQDPNGPLLIPVTATVTANPQALTYSANSVSIPTTPVGITSPASTLNISNVMAFSVSFSSITITGPNASDFAQTNDCSFLYNGTGCSVHLTATPSATGPRTATLIIYSDDPSSPKIIPLSVTGQ